MNKRAQCNVNVRSGLSCPVAAQGLNGSYEKGAPRRDRRLRAVIAMLRLRKIGQPHTIRPSLWTHCTNSFGQNLSVSVRDRNCPFRL